MSLLIYWWSKSLIQKTYTSYNSISLPLYIPYPTGQTDVQESWANKTMPQIYVCLPYQSNPWSRGRAGGWVLKIWLANGQQHESEIEKDIRVDRAMYANHFPTNGPTNNSRPMQQSNQSKKTNMWPTRKSSFPIYTLKNTPIKWGHLWYCKPREWER
jgi:hypothetical protein